MFKFGLCIMLIYHAFNDAFSLVISLLTTSNLKTYFITAECEFEARKIDENHLLERSLTQQTLICRICQSPFQFVGQVVVEELKFRLVWSVHI